MKTGFIKRNVYLYNPNNMNNDLIVKEDMICPVTKAHCDDECCPVGATCNLGGNSGLTSGMNNEQLPKQDDLGDIISKFESPWEHLAVPNEPARYASITPDDNTDVPTYVKWEQPITMGGS